jgi:quercetin dioxygenase-like cupin family protein
LFEEIIMNQNSPRGTELNRRDLFAASLVCAAWAAAGAEAVEAGPPSKLSLTSLDKVEPQTFPWGWIRWLMNAQIDPQAEMTLGVVYVKPHQSNPLHVHPNSAEYLHMLSGECEHLVGDRWVALKAGDTLRIPKGVVHGARTNDQPSRCLVVYDTGKRQMVPVRGAKPAP